MNNKNNSKRLSPQEKPNKAGIQDYDLAQSLNRVRPYSRHSKRSNAVEGTYSDEEKQSQGRREYVSSDSSKYNERTTGAPTWDRYDRLEDRFTSYSDKNEKEHTALRQELEGKIEKASNGIRGEIIDLRQRIDKKLPKWVFISTFSALGVIVAMIWALSYQEVAKGPMELIKLNGRVDKVEKELMEHNTLVDSIMKKKLNTSTPVK